MSRFLNPELRRRRRALALAAATGLALLAGLSGCDQLGIQTPESIAAQREAEGRAIGGACRHAGRAIEDCYTLNRKADKAAVFAGWRDMNDYMAENKIEAVKPELPPPGAPKPAKDDAGDEAEASSKPASDAKHAAAAH